MPQYMLLIYGPADAPQPDDPIAELARWDVYTQALADAGALVGGDALDPAATARTVRVRDGAPQVTDGPFAETREVLGGYYVIDVADMDAAEAWAAKIPSAPHGTIEVRAVMVYPDDSPQAAARETRMSA